MFLLWTPAILLALPLKDLLGRVAVGVAFSVLWLLRVAAGIKYEIHHPAASIDGIPVKPNNHNRADGKAIIASKHMSIMEAAVLMAHIPNPFFIIKRELMWIPIYGWAFWRLGMQPVNRKQGATYMRRLSDSVAEKIKSGMTLVIFPEGTRTRPGAGIKLRRGLLFIAESLKLPIVPVGLDTGLYWPKKGRMHSGTANIWFESPLPSTASLEEIAEAIQRHSA